MSVGLEGRHFVGIRSGQGGTDHMADIEREIGKYQGLSEEMGVARKMATDANSLATTLNQAIRDVNIALSSGDVVKVEEARSYLKAIIRQHDRAGSFLLGSFGPPKFSVGDTEPEVADAMRTLTQRLDHATANGIVAGSVDDIQKAISGLVDALTKYRPKGSVPPA